MSIEDFINAVSEKDYAKAQPMFADMMTQRMNDALDAEKVAVAGQVYSDEEAEQLELDLEDEEADDAEAEVDDEDADTEENTEEDAEIIGIPV